jgi:hypothetical protein
MVPNGKWLGEPSGVIEKIEVHIDARCTAPMLGFVLPNLKEPLQRCIEEILPAF